MNSAFERTFQLLLKTTAFPAEQRDLLTDFVGRIVNGSPAAIAVTNKHLLFAQFNADDEAAIGMLRLATALYERG